MKSLMFKAILLWSIAILFYFYEFFLGVFPGTIANQLMKSLHLNAEHFSIVGSAYYLICGLMQFPAGFIIDRFGVRKVLFIAAFLCSFGTLWFSFAGSFITAVLSRIFMGLGGSFAFIAILVLSLNWFPRKHFSFLTGLAQLLGTIGPFLAGGPFAVLVGYFGDRWRILLLGLGIVGLLITTLIALFLRDQPKKKETALIHLNPSTSSLKDLPNLFKIPQVWGTIFFAGLIYAALPLLGAFWGTSFLKSRGLQTSNAAFIISLVWVGMALGCPLYGRLSEKLMKRKPILLFTSVLGFISSLALIYYPTNNNYFLMITSFLIGFAGAGQSLSFATISEIVPRKYHAASLGLNNSFIVLLSAIVPLFVSSIIETSSRINGHSIYTEASYVKGLTIIPILFLIAFIFGLFGIKETYCRQHHEVHKVKVKKKKNAFFKEIQEPA